MIYEEKLCFMEMNEVNSVQRRLNYQVVTAVATV